MDPDEVKSLIVVAEFVIADARRSGDPSALYPAIDMLRKAAADPSPHLEAALDRLGQALDEQYQADGRPELLDEMVAVDERLVTLTKPDDPRRAQRMLNLAYGLKRQYTTRRDTAALERAANVLRCATEQIPAHPDRALHFLELMVVERTQFEQSRSRAHLEEAVRAARSAVAHAQTFADRARMQSALAEVLEICHRAWGDPTVLDEAISIQRASAAATPADTLAFAARTAKLARALLLKYSDYESRDALEDAVRTLEQCLTLVSDHDDDTRGLIQDLLARAYRHLCEETSDPAMLNRSVDAARSALESDRADVGHLNQLALALHERFRHARDLADLEEALQRNETAIAEAEDADPGLPVLLATQSQLLHAQYKCTSHTATLVESVQFGRHAVARLAVSDTDAVEISDNLVTVLIAMAETVQDPDDFLDEAVGVARAVASTCHEAERADAQALLSRALRSRHEHNGSHPDLDEAIEAAQASARTAEVRQQSRRVSRYSDLGLLLSMRYELNQRAADLDEAIAAIEAALAVPTISLPDRVRQQAFLAMLLDLRFGKSRDRADLDRALAACAAAEAHPEQIKSFVGRLRGFSARLLRDRLSWAAERSTYDAAVEAAKLSVEAAGSEWERTDAQNRLANVLWQRSQATGSDQDLADALALTRQLVACVGSAGRSTILHNLATQLAAMFEATGHTELLYESIDAARVAVNEAEPDDPGIPGYLNGYANRLRTLFQHSRDPDLLRKATRLLREAVAATPSGDTHRPTRLTNLAGGLAWQAEAVDAPALLDEAIEIAREVVRTGSADEVSHASLLLNLGDLLRRRHRGAGKSVDSSDIEEAVDLTRAAVALLPPGDRRLPGGLQALGTALSTRFETSCREADIVEALATYKKIVDDVLVVPQDRVDAAVLWGMGARASGRAREAVRGFSTAIQLLPDLVPRHFLRGDQERRLADLSGLAGFAAASALDVGDFDLAVTLLEQARGVLLAQSFESRGDVSELRERYPEVAEEFEIRRRRLNAVDGPAVPGEGAEERIAARRARVDAWRALCEEIRSLRGFDRFLLPPTASELTGAASDGPVVMPTVGDSGSTALVLTLAGVRAIPLPDLTIAAVRDMVQTFFAALHAAQADEQNIAIRAEKDILGVLGRLWTLLTAPVLNALGYRGRPISDKGLPRVWWVPSGALSFLPIHAAGDHRRRDLPEAPTVMDRVVSSYLPTVRTLIEMRVRKEGTAAPSPLVVALSQTPGERDLPGVRREVEQFIRRMPEAVVLPGGSATHDRVIGELEKAAWVHFACHGMSYPNSPSQSQLLVYDHQDHPLRVLDISRLHLTGAEFVFLSACATAQPTSALTDEAIHVTSAFQLAGFRHVIGTLWSVNDGITARIANRVYSQLIHESQLDPTQSARALHRAVEQIRSRTPDRPSAWAAYIHVGI